MLIAEGPGLIAGPVPSGRYIPFALAASVGLHIAVAGMLLVRLAPPEPGPEPPIEVELVQQAPQVAGVPAPPQAPAAPPPSPPAPRPQQRGGSEPVAAPASPPKPQGRPAPEVNLGNGPENVEGLTVTGENVVPPAPDSRFRNKPPGYPDDAAREGAEGTVQLMVRVGVSGVPISVDIVTSSGNASLDAEARRAVSLWRFRPAQNRGHAVPFDYPLNIHFALGNR